MDLSEIKLKLSKYSKEQIIYNDPHVQINCMRRGVTKEEIIENSTNPKNLKFAHKERSKFRNEEKWSLFFETSKSRTLVIPIVLKTKHIYVITIIKKWRRWEGVIKKWIK